MKRFFIGIGGGTSWSTYWTTRTPSNLILTAISDTQINVTWDDAIASGDGLKIYVNNIYNSTIAFGVQAKSITGLTALTLYTIKLVAYTGVNESTAITSSIYTFGVELMVNGNNEIAAMSCSARRLTTSQSNEQVHGGTYSLKCVKNDVTGSNDGYIWYDALVVGHTYKITAWVYLPSGQTTATLTLSQAGNGGTFTDTILTDQWVKLEQIVLAEYISTSVWDRGVAALNDYWYVDDYSVREIHS